MYLDPHSYVSGWLQGLEDSSTPLIVGTIAIPLSLLNFASEQLGQVISHRFKLLVVVSLGLPLAYLAYQCLDYVVQILLGIFYFLYEGLGYFSTLWVRQRSTQKDINSYLYAVWNSQTPVEKLV